VTAALLHKVALALTLLNGSENWTQDMIKH